MNEDQSPIQEVPTEASVIGTRLREAREALELSREEVALELHLSADQIAHLEDEDFEQFPAPIFVSGYLRKYARLLDIPDEPLVEAFERRGITPPSLHVDLTSGIPRPRKINVEYWAGVLVGFAIIIFLLLWFFSREEGDNKTLSTVTVPPQPIQEIPPVSVELSPATKPPSPVLPSTLPQPVSPPTTPAVAGAKPPSQAESPPRGVAADDSLVLHFTADSWVEISDSSGQRLMFNLGKAGETRSLKGNAPFSILLGYAHGVEIEYNGKSYDHQRHIRNNVARFKLGGA